MIVLEEEEMLNDIRAPREFITAIRLRKDVRDWADGLYAKVTQGKCKTLMPVRFYFDVMSPLYNSDDKVVPTSSSSYNVLIDVASAIETYIYESATIKEYREMCKIYTDFLAVACLPILHKTRHTYSIGVA